ncbi:BtrH N-terminal domain-containing protein [Amycolatopsis sp. H20-H5]|uniref:BtrH N-terminal domain-containing protein n=1 Tax=Amycolatopsis sp. H20-H5 TaxID=3046309 RepID=UPI002DBF2ADC|nr:BtrH N-terminal domain-containing protein [Amycolatopsis sp. H20-H5]MEC3976525.1 BtrH N-terminal domain-containing protein [Amycolatopsis sp. H20-H5]
MSGYELRGGRHGDVAAVANVLAHLGIHGPDEQPVSEALVFVASGGIGAGYVLRDFAREAGSALALGFRSRHEQPQEWLASIVDRLGLEAGVHTTGSKRAAAKRFSAELAEGPVLVQLGGGGGHFVVAYGEEDGRVLLDDRNLAPLTVERRAFDVARDGVGAHKNLLVAIRPGKVGELPAAVRGGLADCARRLAGSLPAWERWAKAMTDGRSAKGWPRVFAERRGLVGALLTVWEGVAAGEHLRGLFADGLGEASDLLELPTLAEQATAWRAIGRQWDKLAEAALPSTRVWPRRRRPVRSCRGCARTTTRRSRSPPNR